MPLDKHNLPLVYSCSGCSNAAQTANHVALQLDRLGLAEMSCIAGVGGDVRPLVKLAQSGRPVIVLDGCALACAKSCLARHGVEPDQYHQLQEYGVKKRFHEDYDPVHAATILAKVSAEIGHGPASLTDATPQASLLADAMLVREEQA